MIRIRDLTLPVGADENALRKKAGKLLGVPVLSLKIRKKSVDARKKPDIRLIYTVDVSVSGDEEAFLRRAADPKITAAPTDCYAPPAPAAVPEDRPVIVGFGPAGMFAALVLAEAGLRPIVLERGEPVEVRTEKVAHFWQTGALDPGSNVQFGEGGAGTFSDGKLNTGVNDPRIAWILHRFVQAGADPAIEWDAKPHIGTDTLRTVVRNLRQEIQTAGGEIRFGTQMTALRTENGAVTGVVTQSGEEIPCRSVILAIGHSARDTVAMLHEMGIPMEPKPFSMGVRIEHPQTLVDRAQYGSTDLPLPAADYKLNVRLPDGGSAYTFCMCPGGYVVAAASEAGGVVTNGMSDHARDGENANSALLVTLRPEDFPYPGALGGMIWQRELEQRAFEMGGRNYHAPAQTVGDFLGKPAAPALTPTYRPGVTWCDLHGVLPPILTNVMEQALPALGRKLKGFDDPGAVMTAPETRSSSPVRIVRGENLQSALTGLYPCGEGAGYAGGITSAAIDGIRCAEAILKGAET